jgi:hypothetical protein
MDPRTSDELRTIRRELAGLRTELGGTAVHIGVSGGGVEGRIIYAQVNEASGVSSGDPTFNVDNARKVVGAIPPGGTAIAQNQYGQTYAPDEWVFLFYDPAADQWLTERGGGTSGSQVVYFELTDNMAYGDFAQLAKPVDSDGNLDTGAADFWVVDEKNRYFGYSQYTDGDSEAETWTGYRGHALRFIDDYSGGKPGFWIISMEGPADFIIADLAEDLGETNPDEALFDWVGNQDVSGDPFSMRRPILEGDHTSSAFDDLGVADGALSGERWILKWSKTGEYYIFWRKCGSVTSVDGWGLLISTIPAVTITTTGASAGTWGSQASAVVLLDVDDTGFTPRLDDDGNAITITGLNCSKTALRGSSTEQIVVWGKIISAGGEPTHFLIPNWDLRSLPGFNSANDQAPYHESGDSDFKLDGEACP